LENISLCGWKGSHVVPPATLEFLQADGIIGGMLPVGVSAGLARRFPMVGCSHARVSASWPRVVNDDGAVGRLAVQTLADRGYTTLALLHTGAGWHYQLRAEGARKCARDIGLPVLEFTDPVRKPGKSETFATVWREQRANRREFLANLPENTGSLAIAAADALESLELLKNDLHRSSPTILAFSSRICPGRWNATSLMSGSPRAK
jgi:DNA-binding LacI/PurR family transcriptional regulator